MQFTLDRPLVSMSNTVGGGLSPSEVHPDADHDQMADHGVPVCGKFKYCLQRYLNNALNQWFSSRIGSKNKMHTQKNRVKMIIQVVEFLLHQRKQQASCQEV